MELCFFCPVTRSVFRSAHWDQEGAFKVCVDSDGQKRLQGRVRVACPLCGGMHDYAPDELPCPMRFDGDDSALVCNKEGGDSWQGK